MFGGGSGGPAMLPQSGSAEASEARSEAAAMSLSMMMVSL